MKFKSMNDARWFTREFISSSLKAVRPSAQTASWRDLPETWAETMENGHGYLQETKKVGHPVTYTWAIVHSPWGCRKLPESTSAGFSCIVRSTLGCPAQFLCTQVCWSHPSVCWSKTNLLVNNPQIPTVQTHHHYCSIMLHHRVFQQTCCMWFSRG